MRSSTELQQLVYLAKRFHLSDPKEAFGRCFSATLELAALAKRHKIPVQLIHWQVRDDHDFCDHWAVLYDRGTIIDPTRVQVDGDSNLMHHIDNYPANYCRPRCYPSELLLPLFERVAAMHMARLPFWFMWQSGMAQLRFDMAVAIRFRLWGDLVSGMAEAAKFGLRSTCIALRYHLVRSVQRSVLSLPSGSQHDVLGPVSPVGPTPPIGESD